MNRTILLLTTLTLLYSPLFAVGKIYWQPNGILITDRDGMVGLSPVPDGKGGVIVFASDGMDSIFAIKVDKNGNLPWTLHGKVLDDNGFGGFQGGPKSVSDGKGGAIAVWDRWYPWGHNLYYNRIDSLGNKAWAGNGVPLTLSDSTQEYHQVVSDGAGGAIAAWQEQRNGQWDIYAQRVDSNGLRQWGDYGKVVCNASNNQDVPLVCSDDSGGVVVSWGDWRGANEDVYAQRVKSDGNISWTSNGINLCNEIGNQGSGVPFSDGFGTIIFGWVDSRNGFSDIYAQRCNNEGNPLWIINGLPVCSEDSNQVQLKAISDLQKGGVFVWTDGRSGSFGHWNVFTQRIDSMGNTLWQTGGIPVSNYDSAQWYPRMVGDNSSGAIISWRDKRNGNYDIYAQHVDSSGNVKWQTNGIAVCTTSYDQQNPEMAPSDSNTAIIIWNDARSGYWRGYAQRVGDDLNGIEEMQNEKSPIANCKLNQNYPNPFKQSTMINYQLTQAGRVSLKIYNVAGQLVRVLTPPNPPLEGRDKREVSVVWDGRDDKGHRVGKGIYFCQLQVDGKLTKTKKMLKIK